MKFEEIDDTFDIDAHFNYWMDISDPRGSYLLSLEHFELDGGGRY